MVLQQMVWNPQRPGLCGIMETVWDHKKRQETLRKIESKEDLRQVTVNTNLIQVSSLYCTSDEVQ